MQLNPQLTGISPLVTPASYRQPEGLKGTKALLRERVSALPCPCSATGLLGTTIQHCQVQPRRRDFTEVDVSQLCPNGAPLAPVHPHTTYSHLHEAELELYHPQLTGALQDGLLHSVYLSNRFQRSPVRATTVFFCLFPFRLVSFSTASGRAVDEANPSLSPHHRENHR